MLLDWSGWFRKHTRPAGAVLLSDEPGRLVFSVPGNWSGPGDITERLRAGGVAAHCVLDEHDHTLTVTWPAGV